MFGSEEALTAPEELRPPGWVELGREFSMVDDPLYHKDPAVSAALKRLEPSAVPLMCRWVFLQPADAQTGIRERVVFNRHAIGRLDMALSVAGKSPEEQEECELALRLTNLEVPPGWIGGIPKYLDPTVGLLDDPTFLGLPAVAPDPRETYKAADLPGPYVPWDWALLHALERMHTVDHTAQQLVQRVIRLPKERKAASNQRDREGFGVAMLDFQKWAQRKLDTATDSEIERQLFKSREKARQARLQKFREQHRFTFKLHS